MSGETQRQDDETEGDGRAWTPPPPHETPETLGDRYSSNLSHALGAANYAARAQSLAVATRGEATRETLATELEVALDEIDALRRRAPPPRPAVDRRSVSAPVEAVASLEADLDALRRDVAALGRPRPASRPTWLLFTAVGVALTAWILTPEDPYAAALAS